MFVVDLIQWWYFRGWGVYLASLKTKLGDTLDFFSIGQLFRTLFMPYRQISAGSTELGGPSAFFDRLISRLVGTFTRLFIIIFGGFLIILEAILGVCLAIIWPLIPLLPILGIALTVMGIRL
ncbi:hypothetical protein IJG78_00190 [Candidatus Saccharibacteria bacterium]|nr:hypothetical protein [Candidatus Saccharibacteria bacterium]